MGQIFSNIKKYLRCDNFFFKELENFETQYIDSYRFNNHGYFNNTIKKKLMIVKKRSH